MIKWEHSKSVIIYANMTTGQGKGWWRVVLNSPNGPNEVTAIDLERPRYASLDAVEVSFLDDQERETFTAKLIFLGDGLLELRALSDGLHSVCFVGICDESWKAVKRETVEIDDEWRNSWCSGGSYPANSRRLKVALQKYRAVEEPDNSDTGGSPEIGKKVCGRILYWEYLVHSARLENTKYISMILYISAETFVCATKCWTQEVDPMKPDSYLSLLL